MEFYSLQCPTAVLWCQQNKVDTQGIDHHEHNACCVDVGQADCSCVYHVLEECGPNEHVPGCRPCSVTCDEQHKPCPKICIHNTKCYCKPQYLKKNGVCVPVSQC
nr:unnamed protein product [Callosobruchus chinensis]